MAIELPGKNQSGGNGCGVAVLIGALLLVGLALGKCSPSSTPSTSAASSTAKVMDSNLKAAVAAQAPPRVAPLSPKRIKVGEANFKVADRAEGLPGDMIYSQNCYDALGSKFSWSMLDTCGAFDARAVAVADAADPGSSEKEIAYFESEAAAGRYLAAATGAGEDPDEADNRLSKLQSRVDPSGLKMPSASPTADAVAVNLNAVDSGAERADPLNLSLPNEGQAF